MDALKLLSSTIGCLKKGRYFELYYIQNINQNVKGFLENVKKEDIDEYDKMLNVLEQFLEIERPFTRIMRNPKRFEQCEKYRDIWEIKNGGRLRISCFFSAKRIIMVRGFYKPTKKVQDREFKNADEIRKRFIGE